MAVTSNDEPTMLLRSPRRGLAVGLTVAAGAVGIAAGILIAGSSAGTNGPQLAPGVRSSVSAVSIGAIALGLTPAAVKVRKPTSESTVTGEVPPATVTTSTASTPEETARPKEPPKPQQVVKPQQTRPAVEEEVSSK
jgi:MFS family permease